MRSSRGPAKAGTPSSVHLPTKNHAEVLRNLINKTAIYEGVVIELVDEIRHFYQFTVATRCSYPLSQSWSDPAKPNHPWNF
jgi:hypothetical protein